MRKNTIKVNGTIFNVNGATAAYIPGKWNNKGNTIYQAYGRPSSRKVSIWNRIESICAAFNGYNLHITSATCFFFSCEFEFKHAGKKYCMRFYPSRWYQVYRVTA